MTRVQIVRGDITTLEVDAIVNAANERMLGGGGVDGAIHTAAGPRLLEACERMPEVTRGVRCPTGQSRITPGFDLAARFVVHTVGPVWRDGTSGEPELLESCYRTALEVARKKGAKTIAFPAISCGVYAFPARHAARIAVDTIQDAISNDDGWQRILLVAYGAEVNEALKLALDLVKVSK